MPRPRPEPIPTSSDHDSFDLPSRIERILKLLRRKLFASAAIGGISLGLVFASSSIASAATLFPDPGSPNGYGFDANAHLVVGGGSTTLFRMAQSLAALWEDTAGCTSNNSVDDAAGAQPIPYPQAAQAFNQCTPSAGQTYAGDSAGGNFDADTVAIATSAGSGTGLESLNGSSSKAVAGTFAYEGAQSNLTTSGDPNALTLPAGDQLSNGYGTVDFDLSSRGPKTSSGNCATPDPNNGNALGDELGCDTFWGVASDGVGIYTFDSAAGVFTSQSGNPANVGLSAQSMYEIYNCDISTWGDLPEYQAAKTAGYAGLPDANAPIVAWAMNSTSGTYGDFNTWIQNNAVVNGTIPAPSGFKADTAGCARQFTTGGAAPLTQPLENDFKPLIVEAGTNAFNPHLYIASYPAAGGAGPLGPPPNVGPEGPPPNYVGVNDLTTFPAGVSTAVAALDSPQNPNNWIWFGSWGLLTQFPFLSCAGQTTPNCPTTVSTPTGAVSFSSGANAVNTIASDTPSGPGTAPGQTVIQAGSYPIERILSVVTKKSDADCPLSSTTPKVCNFSTGTPGPGPVNGNGSTDFNVLGPNSGRGGAIREFVRFLCRPGTGSLAAGTNIAPADPYTGTSVSAPSATGVGGEIDNNAVETSGFRPVPIVDRSTGSTCDVLSFG
jgi:hypothetical protein